MDFTDVEISLITSLGLYSGIGRTASEIRRVLLPSIPKLKLYAFNYFDVALPIGSVSISHHFARHYYEVPLVIKKNVKFIRQQGILETQNLHFLGADYSLSNISNNFAMMLHEYYYTIPEIFRSYTFSGVLKEVGYNYNMLKLKKTARRANKIVVPSSYVAEQLKKQLGLNSTVIHHTVDNNVFHPREREKVRKQLGIPQEKFVILNVSNGGSNKNLKTLEKIAAHLPENYILLKINVPLGNARTLNLGMVSDNVYHLYFSAADAYIHTSTHEGFGFPLLESLKSGLPVVSNREATSEEILSYAGLYTEDPMNYEEYIEQVKTIDDSKERSYLTEKCLSRSLDFSDEIATNKYLKFYKEAFNL